MENIKRDERERDAESYRPRITSFDSSNEVDKIFSALSKAQGEMSGAKKGSENPFFKSKYADLSACYEASRPALVKNQLCLFHCVKEEYPQTVVTTVLGHASGQWISNTVSLKPTKQDPQGTGMAISYGKRYGHNALIALPEEDDDANSVSQPRTQEPNQYRNAQNPNAKVTKPQINRLFAISKQKGWTNDNVKDQLKRQFNLESTKDLTRKQYDELVTTIESGHPLVESAKEVFDDGLPTWDQPLTESAQ